MFGRGKNREKNINPQIGRTDPTTFSSLPPSAPKRIEITSNGIKHSALKEKDGTIYFEIRKGALQQVTARLLKGIINVSDIVQGSGQDRHKFYSKRMPLSKIENTTSVEEVMGEMDFLEALTGDFDHNISEKRGIYLGPGGDVIGRYKLNVSFDEKSVAYYDFEYAQGGLFRQETAEEFNYQKLSPKRLQVMKDRALKFQEQITGVSGLTFIQAILKHVDMSHFDEASQALVKDKPQDSIPSFLQAVLLKKVSRIINKTNEILGADR